MNHGLAAQGDRRRRGRRDHPHARRTVTADHALDHAQHGRSGGIVERPISRLWRTFGLQSHRIDTFKLSADPQFVEKVRDIVGLYLNPPDHALVLCLDEKSQVRALDRTRTLLPMRPGMPAQQTHDYIRHGTTSLFAALDVATGKIIWHCHRRHRHQEFLKFLQRLDAQLPPTGDVHIIMDNYGTHKVPKVMRWLCATRGTTCTSHQRARAGSTRSNGSCQDHHATHSTRHVRERARAGGGN